MPDISAWKISCRQSITSFFLAIALSLLCLTRYATRSGPLFQALNGVIPGLEVLKTGLFGHRGMKGAVGDPGLLNIEKVCPEPNAQSGRENRAQGRRLDHLRPHEARGQNVGLKLHEQVVS